MTLDLLRFTTAGSVDDGKSTLIGRLLYDTKQVHEDQLEHLVQASLRRGGEGSLDLALLTDGLRAEREQGITIDVAYRYFATAKRRFIIADTPGHLQYTRNMVTGASTADLAVVLIDARHGVLEQSRRHAFISSLLGIPHLVVAVNKMDLVDYSRSRFEEIVAEFAASAAQLSGVRDIVYIPLSALHGDNVVTRSQRMDWYEGTPLLELLESVEVAYDHPVRDTGALPRAVGHTARRRRRRHGERGERGCDERGAEQQRAPGGRRARALRRRGRLPRLCRPARERRHARGRRGGRAARRPAHADRRDRHLRRAARGGTRADVRDAAPRGRRRHLPRRAPIAARGPAGWSRASSRRTSAG